MDRIKAFLAAIKTLASVPDAELLTLEAEGMDLFDDLRAGNVEGLDKTKALDEARKIAAGVEAIRTEAANRIEAAVAVDEEFDKIAPPRAEIPDTPEGAEGDGGEGDQPTEPAPVGDQPEPAQPEGGEGDGGNGDGEPGEPTPAPAPAQEPEAVVASTSPAPRPDLSAFAARSQTRTLEPDTTPLPDGPLDLIGPGGRRVTSYDEGNQLLWQALRDNEPLGGRAVKTTVLVERTQFPEAQTLHPNDTSDNGAKVDALVAAALNPERWAEIEGMVAAGQFCAPSEPFYAMPTQGDRGRPLRDGLPQMGLTRGSVEVPATPLLTDIVTDDTNGAIDTLDPSSSTGSKTIQEVLSCPSTTITYLEATTLRLRFDNFNAMTWMERQNAWLELARVALDRHRERRLMAKMDALSTVVTESFVIGAYRDVLNHIGRIVSAERHRLRLSPDTRFRVAFDFGLLDAMREDLAMQSPGDGLGALARAEAEIRADLAARGINLTVVWDRWIPAAQGAGAMTWWPATWRINVFPEGTFMFGSGPDLNIGVVRDGTELTGNTFQYFEEGFETVFKTGSWPAYAVDLQVCVNGTAAALKDTSGECQGS